MITVEQIQKLDQKVHAAVKQIGGLRQENSSLKTKLDEYQKRIGELEVMIDRFKQDQQEIENGILRALEKLDQLEDSSQETAPEPKADDDPPAESPVEETSSEQDGSELDIFLAGLCMGEGIPIHVLGNSFSIQTDENPKYVEKLVSYVTAKVETLQKSIDTKDNIRLLVLASVLITDELFKERESPKAEGGADDLGDLTESIIARLDEALEK